MMATNPQRQQQPSHAQRRTFRGRGGPTDGRLPPPKQPHRRHKHNNNSNTIHHDEMKTLPASEMWDRDTEDTQEDTLVKKDDVSSVANTQLLHLQQRIRHNRTSMSQTTVSHLQHYQTHVLAAVRNTLAEWNAIARTMDYDEDELYKTIVADIFGLVQQALQTGPLVGAKPGYFKRCGSQVAAVVVEFLTSIMEACEWTQRQAEALQVWKKKAETAAAKETEPSKSVQKKMKNKKG